MYQKNGKKSMYKYSQSDNSRAFALQVENGRVYVATQNHRNFPVESIVITRRKLN